MTRPTSLLDAVLNRNGIYNTKNNAGEGYAIGADDADVNDLASEIGGSLVHAATTDDDVAVYSVDGGFVFVGNSYGPWAVAV